jgi:hypothetical protein
VFPSGFVTVEGSKRPVPRFYRNKLSDEQKELLRQKAEAFQETRKADAEIPRLQVREEVLNSKLRSLKRTL